MERAFILPNPQQYTVLEQTFDLINCTGIIIAQPALLARAQLLQQSVKDHTGIELPITTPLAIGTRLTVPMVCHGTGGAIILKTEEKDIADAYELSIQPDGITISAADSTGVLYGVQTLRQIISQQGAVLTCAQILDYPDMKNRGFYHDVTRGRIPDLAALKKLADRCSYYKINQLQLYIEHSYLFANDSEVWRDETPLTAQEIMEFDQYCQSLGIDLIPSVSSFGHLYKLLETKTYHHLNELSEHVGSPASLISRMQHHTMDASNPEALAKAIARIDEYMSLFSSKYFNICADETFDIGKDRTKELCEKHGKEQVYTEFVARLCEHVVSCGKIPMFWGDIISKAPEKIQQLPNCTICLNWGYAPDQSDDTVKAFKEVGARQYLCPGVQNWHSLIPQMRNAYENISRMCRYGHTYGAEGILNTDWGDMGHVSHPDFSAPGLIMGAALSWNKNEMSYEELCQQISVVEFGQSGVMDALTALSGATLMYWNGLVFYKENTQGYLEAGMFTDYFASLCKKAMQQMTPERVNAANQTIADSIQHLSELLHKVSAQGRETLNAFIQSAFGQILLNEIALHLNKDNKGAGALHTPKQLAVLLENWLMGYKTLWRRYGKESDLVRVQDVICWYADLLREMA